MSAEQKWAMEQVLRERARQNIKWGEQNHDMGTWMLILHEETGELSETELHRLFGGPKADSQMEEAIQVAAVALQIVEYLKRRDPKP